MKKITLAFLAAMMLLVPALSFAQGFDIDPELPPPTVSSFGDFVGVFNRLISWLFTLLLILAVIFIILAAFSYLTAGGDEEKIKGAHKKIMFAVVALVVAFLAQGIQFIVRELLGVSPS